MAFASWSAKKAGIIGLNLADGDQDPADYDGPLAPLIAPVGFRIREATREEASAFTGHEVYERFVKVQKDDNLPAAEVEFVIGGDPIPGEGTEIQETPFTISFLAESVASVTLGVLGLTAKDA